MFRFMLRFVLLGLAAGIVGLTVGWMVPADKPANLSSRAPINIDSVHTFRTEPLSAPSSTPIATSDVPEVTDEPSGSGAARKRKQLKTRLAAAASVKPGVQIARCGDDNDEDDEC